MKLKNKVALVTGGSSGIGKAAAVLLAKKTVLSRCCRVERSAEPCSV